MTALPNPFGPDPRGPAKYVATITAEDVRARRVKRSVPACPCCGQGGGTRDYTPPIGGLLPCDIGKRVYQSSDGQLSVENNKQRDERQAREGTRQ